MWKDFLYFSKHERRSITILIILIIGILSIRFLYPLFQKQEDFHAMEDLENYHDFIASVQKNDSLRKSESKTSEANLVSELFPFDPNTADSITFIRLGLKPYVARNILKYRERGGWFRDKQSFAKVYGLSSEQFAALAPYIHIKKEQRNKSLPKTKLNISFLGNDTLPVKKYSKTFKYPHGTVIDLNLSDTTELKKIPGIGSGRARMITTYRNRLGGYHDVAQLQELDNMPDSLNKWFQISDRSLVCRINLNTASLERLKSHPYINFYQSKVIVEYRKKKGKLKDLKQLSLYEEFASCDLERINPYACFD